MGIKILVLQKNYFRKIKIMELVQESMNWAVIIIVEHMKGPGYNLHSTQRDRKVGRFDNLLYK